MNMFGNGMMKKMQEMQAKMEEVKNKLDKIKLVGEEGDVRVEVNGNEVVTDIQAPPNMNQEILIAQIGMAANRALEQAYRTKEMEMAQSAKGIIPGM